MIKQRSELCDYVSLLGLLYKEPHTGRLEQNFLVSQCWMLEFQDAESAGVVPPEDGPVRPLFQLPVVPQQSREPWAREASP